jgi:hypothetical protein
MAVLFFFLAVESASTRYDALPERCVCINNRGVRDALQRVPTKSRRPRTYATSLRTFPQQSFRPEYSFEDNPTVAPTGHYGENHLACKREQLLEEERYLHNKKSRTTSEWLDVCGIDLCEHEFVGYVTSWTNSPTSVSSPSRLLVNVLLGKSSRMTGLRTSRLSKS